MIFESYSRGITNSPFDIVGESEWGFSSNFHDVETVETGFMPTDNLSTGENGIDEMYDEPLSMDLVGKIDLFNPCVGNDTQNFPFITFEGLGNFLKSPFQENAQEALEQNSCTSNTENTPEVSKKRTRKPSSGKKETLNTSKKRKKDPYSSTEYGKSYREAQKKYNEHLEEKVTDLFKTFKDLLKQMKAKSQNSLQPPDQDMLQKSFNELRESLRPLDYSSWKNKNNVIPFSEFAKSKSNLNRSSYYNDIRDKYNSYKILLINKLFKKINQGRALLELTEIIEEPAVSFYEFRQSIKNKDHLISKSQTESLSQNSNQENQKIFLEGYNIKAIGYLLKDNRLLVKKDSEACMIEAKSLKEYYIKIRQQLVKDKILILEEKRYKFTKDYIFRTPTLAASAILGTAVNGKRYWKNESGQSITKVESNKSV